MSVVLSGSLFLQVPVNQNQKLSTIPLYSHHVQLCLLPSPSPSICSYESVFSLTLFCRFPSVGWSQKKIKAVGWSLSFGWTQTWEYRENRRGKGRTLGEKTRREKTCHVGLVLLPSTVRRRVLKENSSEERVHSCRYPSSQAKDNISFVRPHAVCDITGEGGGRDSNGGITVSMGGTPKFKEGALSRPCCAYICLHKRRTTHITSLCLLIALCCFVFLSLPVFVHFQCVLEPNPCPISSLSTSACLKAHLLTNAC